MDKRWRNACQQDGRITKTWAPSSVFKTIFWRSLQLILQVWLVWRPRQQKEYFLKLFQSERKNIFFSVAKSVTQHERFTDADEIYPSHQLKINSGQDNFIVVHTLRRRRRRLTVICWWISTVDYMPSRVFWRIYTDTDTDTDTLNDKIWILFMYFKKP